MLIKSGKKATLTSSPGDVVKKDQLDALINNYYVRTKRYKVGRWENLDIASDSKSAWFPKEKLDELFEDNGCNDTNNSDYGLKISFGIHKLGILNDGQGNDIPTMYENQQMVILIVTKKNSATQRDEDQLTDENYINISGYTGNALDNGKLCPPQNCD